MIYKFWIEGALWFKWLMFMPFHNRCSIREVTSGWGGTK